MLEPEEIAAALPESDKTLAVESVLRLSEFDDVCLDRPYYLVPSDAVGEVAFLLIREALRAESVGALARTVLFRRMRNVLITAKDAGLIATTLHFDYEVRSAEDAFHEIPDMKIKGEMLDLAKHIIATKTGSFDPATFADRYEAALVDLVRAKAEGRPIAARKTRASEKVIDLMEVLRKSAQQKLSLNATARPKPHSPKQKASTRSRKPVRKHKGSTGTAERRRAG